MSSIQNENIVGENIGKLRHRKGWTQEILAVKVQLRGHYITKDIIANIESYRTRVSDRRVLYFAEVLGVKAGELFADKPVSFERAANEK